jgi:hypothetical protein
MSGDWRSSRTGYTILIVVVLLVGTAWTGANASTMVPVSQFRAGYDAAKVAASCLTADQRSVI